MAFGVAGQNGYACDICHYQLTNLQCYSRARVRPMILFLIKQGNLWG